jgi:probable O-glycosylation ligase (exosortase A-associated)
MRDGVLSLLIGGLLLSVFRHPEVGAYLWAWLSIMNPHKLTFGFARALPWAQVTAAVTLTMLLFSRRARKPFPISAITVVYVALMAWMSVTSLTSINPVDDVKDRWIFVFKIHLMTWVTLMLLRGRKQIEILLWVLVFSVGFYGVKGGIFTLATGGTGRVWGPPGGMLEGNNELAVALVVVSPLMFSLHHTTTNRWIRRGLILSMIVSAFAILGTQSRGALLALLSMAILLGLKSRHPVRASLMIMGLVGIAITFMPDSWSKRMDTIQEYRADTSAMSRIYTWNTLWNVAVDRPLVGAGFAADNLPLFNRYAPHDEQFGPVLGTVWVAHSIYFQALGEHGFVGASLFITLFVLTWFRAGRLAVRATGDPEFEEWVPLLMRMVQSGLIGYAVGGAFLSLMHLDLMYYVVALVVLVEVTMTASAKRKVPSAATNADAVVVR